MAAIDTGHLSTIAEENQRLIETAKGLWSVSSVIANTDPKASSQLREQINRLLDISERISSALATAR
jgi:hypothetical protein